MNPIVGVIVPKSAKKYVPKHDILSIIGLRKAVMNVVILGVIESDSFERIYYIETGVVEAGKGSAEEEEEEDG